MNPILYRLANDIPMMSDSALEVAAALSQVAECGSIQLGEHPWLKRFRMEMNPKMELRDDGTAIIPMQGILGHRPSVWEVANGVEDSAAITQLINSAAANDQVQGILIASDSPGGFHTGGADIVSAVRNANKVKPVVMHATQASSMAFWVASQAQEIVASAGASVGSIGGFVLHLDRTQMLENAGVKVEVIKNREATLKAAGIFGTALTDEQRSNIQASVQAVFDDFKNAVKTSRPNVSDDAMKGQSFIGRAAKKAGLVDRIGDQNFALSVLKSHIRARGRS